MPSPFPGMNPYLENSELWSGFHHLLIAALLEVLAPQLEPKYIVAIERRIYEVIGENPLLVGFPNVMVQRPLNATNSITNVASLSPPAQPITVTVPIPETIRQSYLEVPYEQPNIVCAFTAPRARYYHAPTIDLYCNQLQALK